LLVVGELGRARRLRSEVLGVEIVGDSPASQAWRRRR
jgi:hypothetical protein